jgi:hypothetical protein
MSRNYPKIVENRPVVKPKPIPVQIVKKSKLKWVRFAGKGF